MKPTDAALLREGWVRCASVRAGGKPYFWYRRNPETDRREWWLWSRHSLTWEHLRENAGERKG